MDMVVSLSGNCFGHAGWSIRALIRFTDRAAVLGNVAVVEVWGVAGITDPFKCIVAMHTAQFASEFGWHTGA